MDRAKLPFSLFAPVKFNGFPIDKLKATGVISSTYEGNNRQAVFDLSSIVLLEALAAIPEHRFLVFEENVAVKHYILEAFDALSHTIPAKYDVLFLDCPAACKGVFGSKVGVSPVKASCVNPGSHAAIIGKSAVTKLLSKAIPLVSSWDKHIGARSDIEAYCVWPKLAEIVPQWQLWRLHV